MVMKAAHIPIAIELIIIWFVSSCFLLQADSAVTFSIGTYNLWNVMFNWKVRLQHVANMIREHDLDMVVFQEVRLNKCDIYTKNCPSQLDELKWRLPGYKWAIAYPAGKVTRMKASFTDEWGFEGLGIISRKPIVSSEIFSLKKTSFRDQNKRIVIHVRVKVGPSEDDVGDVFIVHFSYDPQQQCDNANDVIKLIRDARLKHSIVLGDFNVYDEMSPAVGQFVGSSGSQSGCPGIGENGRDVLGSFQDVWLSGGKDHLEGLTFSNMPTPGPQSRPDRILVSQSIGVNRVGLAGNGSNYWSDYHLTASYHRGWTVLRSAYHSFLGIQGYSCPHDCGPHGSCRCGVCVKGGNQNNCLLPDCSQCTGVKFITFILFSFVIFVGLFIFFMSAMKILVISARFNQNDITDVLGYRCCLFNRQLFQFKVVPRRLRIKFVSVFKLINNLPPMLTAVVSLSLLCAALFMSNAIFHDGLEVVLSVLPEEMFPSDHKMLFAELDL